MSITDKANQNQQFLNFMEVFFEVQQKLQVMHYKTKNYNKHQIIGEFLEKIQESADNYIEIAISLGFNIPDSALDDHPTIFKVYDPKSLLQKYMFFLLQHKEFLLKAKGFSTVALEAELDSIFISLNKTVFKLGMD